MPRYTEGFKEQIVQKMMPPNACNNGQVTFRYQNSKTKRYELSVLSDPQFLWLILQRILPRGFRRARNFGFLHPNSKRLISVIEDEVPH